MQQRSGCSAYGVGVGVASDAACVSGAEPKPYGEHQRQPLDDTLGMTSTVAMSTAVAAASIAMSAAPKDSVVLLTTCLHAFDVVEEWDIACEWNTEEDSSA